MSNKNLRRWTGPMVWDADRIGPDEKWIVQLTDHDIKEISAAAKISRETEKPIASLVRADFPLEDLGDRLTGLKNELLNGRGFSLLRGLPADHWTDEDLIRACWGIGTWIGDPVSQNSKAHLLGHIINQRTAESGENRMHQTNRAQPFHSDSCDIVGLLCLRTAKHGGACSIASAAAIHNELLDNDPTVLKQLYGSFDCDRYGQIPEGKEPTYAVQIFNEIDKQLVCCGLDPDIHSAQRLERVPRLTDEQTHALDMFQRAAAKLSLTMSLQRGDIQLSNNLTTVHAHKTFVDYIDPDKRRYLIRLCLSSKHGRQLPEFLSERWGSIAVGSIRGGINAPGAVPTVHLKPEC